MLTWLHVGGGSLKEVNLRRVIMDAGRRQFGWTHVYRGQARGAFLAPFLPLWTAWRRRRGNLPHDEGNAGDATAAVSRTGSTAAVPTAALDMTAAERLEASMRFT